MPDAILVPGGGLRENGDLPPWVIARLDKALEIANGAAIITLSAGSPHRPGMPVFESVAGAQYLIERGYPENLVLSEAASYDTIGNAWFARLIHTDPAGYRDLCVVTSDFHMPRTDAIFRWIFAATPVTQPYRMAFLSTVSDGLTTEARNARMEKERKSLAALLPNIERLSSLKAIHLWLYSEHEVYATGLRPSSALDSAVLQSY